MLAMFAGGALTAKDYVKSAKHRWQEACFIPAGATREKFESVVEAFVRIRGESLNRGRVFREFVELLPVGKDVISGRTVFAAEVGCTSPAATNPHGRNRGKLLSGRAMTLKKVWPAASSSVTLKVLRVPSPATGVVRRSQVVRSAEA